VQDEVHHSGHRNPPPARNPPSGIWINVNIPFGGALCPNSRVQSVSGGCALPMAVIRRNWTEHHNIFLILILLLKHQNLTTERGKDTLFVPSTQLPTKDLIHRLRVVMAVVLLFVNNYTNDYHVCQASI
jgi:hypothetical protein